MVAMSETFLVPQASVVLVACPSHAVALDLSQQLVTCHLAACVNVIPGIISVYEWEGALCQEAEVLMVVKTTSQAVEALIEFVQAHHPYKCPEIVALPIVAGSHPYLSWVMQQAKSTTIHPLTVD